MIRFRTLGRIDLRDDSDRPIRSILGRPKRLALLAYLALAEPNGMVQRDSLLALFWPELPQARARHALNQALYVLRRGTGSEIFQSHGTEAIGLNPGQLWCDASAFSLALDLGRAEEALELYGGELLEGFHVPGAPDFERWHEETREALRRRATHAARSLAADRRSKGDLPGAAYWLRAAAARAPHDEELIHDLIGVLRAGGDRTGALREYEIYTRRLAADLELEPADRITDLAARIRDSGHQTIAPGGPGEELEDPEALTPAVGATADARVATHLQKTADAPDRRRPGRRVLLAGAFTGAAAALFFLLSGGVADLARRSEPLVPNRILVAALENRTGEPELDPLGSIASAWLTEGLGRTGMVEVVPYATLVRASGAGERDPSIGEIALGANAGLTIAGEYYRAGDSVVFHVRMLRSGSGELLRAFEPVATLAADPMEAVEEIRRHAMGALAAQVDPRLQSWADAASHPPSISAYRLYTTGIELFARGEYERAIERFDEAAAAEPGFRAPRVWSAHTYAWAGRSAEADSVLRTLEPERDSLAPWEAAMSDYYRASLHQEWRAAYDAARRLVRIAPRSEWSYFLAAASRMLGRPAEAVRHLEAVGPELAGDWFPYWAALLGARHQAGDYDRELRDARRRARAADPCCRTAEVRALIAVGRLRQALRLLDIMVAEQDDWRGKAALVESTAGELLGHGHSAHANPLLERALALRVAATDRSVATQSIGLARALYRVGRLDESEALLTTIAPDEPTGNRAGYLALIAARRGDLRGADRHAEWYAAGDRLGGFWAALWHARIAAARDEPDVAVGVLRRAVETGEMGVFPWVHADPELAPLFEHPPFQALLRAR